MGRCSVCCKRPNHILGVAIDNISQKSPGMALFFSLDQACSDADEADADIVCTVLQFSQGTVTGKARVCPLDKRSLLRWCEGNNLLLLGWTDIQHLCLRTSFEEAGMTWLEVSKAVCAGCSPSSDWSGVSQCSISRAYRYGEPRSIPRHRGHDRPMNEALIYWDILLQQY